MLNCYQYHYTSQRSDISHELSWGVFINTAKNQ